MKTRFLSLAACACALVGFCETVAVSEGKLTVGNLGLLLLVR